MRSRWWFWFSGFCLLVACLDVAAIFSDDDDVSRLSHGAFALFVAMWLWDTWRWGRMRRSKRTS